MITFIDRSITKYAISPVAILVARAQGRSRDVLGGRMLVLASMLFCGLGMLLAGNSGRWGQFCAFLLMLIYGIFTGCLCAYLGEYEYGKHARLRASAQICFADTYTQSFVLKLVRVMMTAAVVAALIFWIRHVEKDGWVEFLLSMEMITIWMFLYFPTVRPEIVEPHVQ